MRPATLHLFRFEQRALTGNRGRDGSSRTGSRSSSSRSLRLYVRFGGRRLRFLNIDTALEERSVVDGDAGGGDVAGQRGGFAELNALRGMDIAVHLAVHDHVAGFDVGAHSAIW